MSAHKYQIYGIGNAIMDYQIGISDVDFKKFNLEPGSMTLVDADVLNQMLTELPSGVEIKRSSGGSGANTIISLAQLGHSVAYGCIVGDDEVGTSYLGELKSLGVSTFNDPIREGLTGRSLVMITSDAERTMSTCLGITSTYDVQHLSEQAIKESEWIYIEGYLFATPEGQRASLKAVSLAKEYGTKIAVTFSDGFIVEVFRDALHEVASASDLIFANKNEALKFMNTTDPVEAFRGLRSLAGGGIAVTLSEKGAIVGYGQEVAEIESYPVKAIDDTGAGDMFAGGFMHGLLSGLSARDSGKIACYLAGKVVSQYGARINGDLRSILDKAQIL